ncbi:iron-sulfur cluster biosynthesis family protein [Enterococcus sp. CSURQ0835]|uniref:iron-sulfur cluster biosynthesis family protein n=1 Tax=Enterococcus sp. CSURQ0835 TaxID=2681394 RepID=UPI0013581626|nr:iron-sulfur cluster biosynthesis family protein [Enterococcus sp. CSURQ0835]
MELTLSNQANAVLQQKIGAGEAFILAARNTYTQVFPCAKGSFFQIVPLIVRNQFTDRYQARIKNADFTVYTCPEDQAQLGEDLQLDYDHKLHSFTLKDEHHVLDHNIKLKNYFFS